MEHWQVVPHAKPTPHLAKLKLAHGDVGGIYSKRIRLESEMKWRWCYGGYCVSLPEADVATWSILEVFIFDSLIPS